MAGAEAEAITKEEAVAVAMVPEALPGEALGVPLGALPVGQPREEGATAALPVFHPKALADKYAETSFREGAREEEIANSGIIQLASSIKKEGVIEMTANFSIPNLAMCPETPLQDQGVNGAKLKEADLRKRSTRKTTMIRKRRAGRQSNLPNRRRRKRPRMARSAGLFLT